VRRARARRTVAPRDSRAVSRPKYCAIWHLRICRASKPHLNVIHSVWGT